MTQKKRRDGGGSLKGGIKNMHVKICEIVGFKIASETVREIWTMRV